MQFLKIPLTKNNGFTLIELITVIVLLGIIGIMGSEIITTSFRGFADTDTTMELFEEGKLAMMRMEREIHHMVPNAIDNPSNASAIRFGVIDENTLNRTINPITGQYQPLGASLNIRDLSNNALDGVFISIYNTSWTDFSSANPVVSKLYHVTSPSGTIMTLDRVVNGGHSATRRYYPVQKAVQYYLSGTSLFRSEIDVALPASNFVNNFPSGNILLANIQPGSLSFNYTPASLTRNAMVRVNFTLARDGITLDFHKEIQVRNVP